MIRRYQGFSMARDNSSGSRVCNNLCTKHTAWKISTRPWSFPRKSADAIVDIPSDGRLVLLEKCRPVEMSTSFGLAGRSPVTVGQKSVY